MQDNNEIPKRLRQPDDAEAPVRYWVAPYSSPGLFDVWRSGVHPQSPRKLWQPHCYSLAHRVLLADAVFIADALNARATGAAAQDSDEGPRTAHELAGVLLAGEDLPVVLSSDAEGNTFDLLADVSPCAVYDKGIGEAYMTPEEFAADQAAEISRFTEDDEPPEVDGVDIVRAVVLYPV